jgi:hypothetical protein
MKSIFACLGFLLLGACSANGFAPGVPITGNWGGEHVRLALTSAGGDVEYDCAHGGITEALVPDNDGTFDAKGVHIREHGGPVRQDEKVDSLPARYVGRIHGDEMDLRVLVAPDSLGPFVLVRGEAGRVFKCL